MLENYFLFHRPHLELSFFQESSCKLSKSLRSYLIHEKKISQKKLHQAIEIVQSVEKLNQIDRLRKDEKTDDDEHEQRYEQSSNRVDITSRIHSLSSAQFEVEPWTNLFISPSLSFFADVYTYTYISM